jgi:hypothetical protein
MNNKVTMAAIAVAVIALAALAYTIYGAKPTSNSNTNTVNNNVSQAPTNTAEPKPKYTYQFEGGFNPDYSKSTADGKIYQIDEKGVKTLVVPSIKDAYPELKQAFNWTFGQVSQSTDKGYLYFTKILLETDAPPTDIIRFDGNTKKFTKLSTSPYFFGYGTASASKSTPWAVSMVNPQSEADEQSLYLIDLDRDSAKLVIKLPAGQSFNFCHEGGCLGGKIGQIEWLTGTQYQVGIYSTTETTKDQYGNIERKLIEKRKFNIN